MKKATIASPYLLWMGLFIVIPLFLVLYYSFTIKTDTGISFTLEHYQRFFDPLYLTVLTRSLNLALQSTIVCLLLGYPMAMILADKGVRKKNLLVVFFILPMWMNLLLRTYAWMSLLEKKGLINTLLGYLNLGPLSLMYNNEAVILGMVYNFLPFMVLPIYSVLTKIDYSLIEAAEDLGANKITVFFKVILPLSLPGVMSGITMVFMPAVTTFVISRLLGGSQFTLIGNLIEKQFLLVNDWHFGSSISILMMIVILISMAIMSRYEQDDVGRGGLW